MKKTVVIVCMILLQLAWNVDAAVIDAPHNQAGGISCGNCHTYSLWWQFSPSDNSPDRANLVEVICAICHEGNGTAPHVTTHSSAALGSLHRADILPLSGWGRTCVDCHDPHFQQQLRGWAGDTTVPDTELYLAQGTIGTITNSGSTITYTLNQSKTKPAWADPADWTNKTGSGRGLLLVVSANGMENSYKVVSAIENSQTPGTGSISVQGVIPSLDDKSFGLIYGQLIKKQIAVDPDRDGVFQKVDVKFFDGKGGFVDDDPADGITGLCQVCHGQTLHYVPSMAPDSHINVYGVANAATLQCTICHSHQVAFGHGNDGGAGCGGCHDNEHDNGDGTFTYSKHVEHLNLEIKCSSCHDPINIRNASGEVVLKDGEHIATTAVCLGCHHDGTDLTPADGNVPPNQPDYKSGWSDTAYVFACNGCHGTPPSYTTGGLNKANSHFAHANDQISCVKCHYSTTEDGATLLHPGSHADNIYSVSPAPGVSLTYSAGTCSNISCHLGNTETWGATLTCLNCHQTSGPDVEGVIDPNAVAQINVDQWTTSGHGRPANEQYTGSNNQGAGLTCYYCHDNTIAHGSAVTPFRLVNIGGPDGMNGVCLTCHKTGAPGYQPPYAGMDLIGSTRAVNSFHGYNDGLGGKFCWDCHDPHGDANIYMIHDRVSLRSDKVTGAPTLQSMPVVFTLNTSGADYAKTDPLFPFNGICNVCHLNTKHYTSTSGDGGHDDGERCTNCHHHNGSQPDNAFSQGECLGCHDIPRPEINPTRRAIDSEFPQTTETAGDAHAHFGGQLDSDDCRVCHNQIYHMDGLIRLWGGDQEVQINLRGELENTSIVYIGNNAGDMVNIEAQQYEDISDFCMSCHDSDGMNSSPYPFDPFGNGNLPPDVATRFKGTRVKSEDFTDPYLGMFGTGRKVLSHHPLSKSDQVATGAKIECTNCHGAHSVSINTKLADPDDTSRSWGAGLGETMNVFCLKCHDGGENPHHPGFPAGVAGPKYQWYPAALPGAKCPDNYNIYDCRGNCVDPYVAADWSVDGVCDDGTWGVNLQCAAFGNDNGKCGPYVNNDGYSLLKGLETCEGYSQPPWDHHGTKISWSKEAHGGGTKRLWPGYVQTPPVPVYELNCIDCHDHHGSYNPITNTDGNPYMIRDFVDGTKYVDDGNIRRSLERFGCSDVTTNPPACSKFGASGAVVIDKPNFKKKDGGLDSTTYNGWVNFCVKCHDKWGNATGSGGHLINGGYSSCLSCHAHGTVTYGGQDNYGYPFYMDDPDNTPEILCQ